MREGSSSSEVPLSPSPKPPPQASLLLRPPLLPGQIRASAPLAEPHLSPGGTPVLVSLRPWPPTRQGLFFGGQTTSHLGAAAQKLYVRSPILRELGLDRHTADTVRPPGGVRGPLGDQPRPRPAPAPKLAPPLGVAPPRPQPTVEAEPGQMLGPAARLQPGSGGPDGTSSRRESPLERGSAPGGDCRCETGQPGRGALRARVGL